MRGELGRRFAERNEEWRPIFDAAGYFVNENGEILNKLNGRMMKPYVKPDGTHQYSLSGVGVLAHNAVADAFLEHPEGRRRRVRHIDGDKSNNHYSNLEFEEAVRPFRK